MAAHGKGEGLIEENKKNLQDVPAVIKKTEREIPPRKKRLKGRERRVSKGGGVGVGLAGYSVHQTSEIQ